MTKGLKYIWLISNSGIKASDFSRRDLWSEMVGGQNSYNRSHLMGLRFMIIVVRIPFRYIHG